MRKLFTFLSILICGLLLGCENQSVDNYQDYLSNIEKITITPIIDNSPLNDHAHNIENPDTIESIITLLNNSQKTLEDGKYEAENVAEHLIQFYKREGLELDDIPGVYYSTGTLVYVTEDGKTIVHHINSTKNVEIRNLLQISN
ncbi:hypothetical protein [Marinicrinis lubricantis]|uniref:Prokaryotic membrane lipoprotein lipid attachment site profile n=1 Tax=Marinicrinis lubricantis TaxID=2086470 RepID=A0ABW1IN24_9BACL